MIGDHIRTLRAGRWTHAIDCGDETVILLADGAAAPLRVRRSYRPEFVAGAETVEVVLHRERTFPAEEVVARAYSRISDPALASMFRDSEAFAEWCTTGRLPSAPPSVAIAVPGVAAGPAAAAKPARPTPRTKAAAKAKRAASAKASAAARAKPAAKPRVAARPKGGARPARKAAKARPAGKARASAARKPARTARRRARR